MTALGVPRRVVVVGSGIAGLTAALHAASAGCRVTLVTKDALEHANTRFAQGGIAGVIFDDDRVADHVRDTLVAGGGLADPEAARVLAEEGPARIRELVALGVAFDRAPDGAFAKGLEAAHSYPRVLHAGGDATGLAIERALVARVRAADIEVIEHAFLVDLERTGARVTGVDLLLASPDPGAAPVSLAHTSRTEKRARATPQRLVLEAEAVVLATGGAGQLYAHTTNPPVATGDGIAAASRAGAEVADLEFLQFHPTVLPSEPGAEPFLVSEAVRGEGAVLIDDDGRRFAFDDHPDGELAPRDVVARSIVRCMARQDGRPALLDATALGTAFLERRFPTIDRAVRARGLDWAANPIAVRPAAHYLMGGVVTDLHGRTSIPGLYAVGEVARTGVHGANRLASNSLLEGAVFGARAGAAVATDILAPAGAAQRPAEERTSARPRTDPRDSVLARADALAPGEHLPAEAFSRTALQRLMWEDAGLVRTGAGLATAASTLGAWRATPRHPRTVAEFEDENLLLVAAEVVDAARRRTASVGAHFRADEPRELRRRDEMRAEYEPHDTTRADLEIAPC